MKCELNKPSACFNCPYPECLDYSTPSKAETEMLNAFIPDRKTHRTDARRKEEKQDRREYLRQYCKEHAEEIRKYYKEYTKKRRAVEIPDISAWKAWGIGFYINLDTREKVMECPI